MIGIVEVFWFLYCWCFLLVVGCDLFLENIVVDVKDELRFFFGFLGLVCMDIVYMVLGNNYNILFFEYICIYNNI